ncbi:MAG: N-acetyltransferase [Alphaproteobacteria bacterium]|nr:MAG: N-acetyltransferase [Alphaproteobacteria bacterium]
MQTGAIRPLQDGDATLIGHIIAEAFADDPVNLWAFNGTGAMAPVFTAMARYLYIPKGFGHVTDDGLAGTMWLPPGAQKTYGIGGNLAMARAIVWHGGLRAVKNSLAIDAFMAKNRPAEPHYYLFAIGVSPALQGRGIGGRLMKEALDRADTAHMPAYLENSKAGNIGFYRSHGFEIMDEVVPAPGCPVMWRMWRPAR